LTIYSLAFWTDRRWPDGEKGGALEYRWLGISTVYHVVDETLVAVFSFPDVTAYLIAVLVVFDLAVLILNLGLHVNFDRRRMRNYVFLGAIIAVLCLWVYGSTMKTIEAELKEFDVGGVVGYYPQLGFIIYVTNVHEGYVESLGGPIFDFPNILFILFLIFTVIVRFHRPNEQYSVVPNEKKPT
jgi:hypothetical protein